MPEWFVALEMKDLDEGSMKAVELGGTKVLLVHGASGIRAFEDRCGHMAAPLSLGTFKSGVLKCPLHSSVFDAATGAVRGQPVLQHAPPGTLPPQMEQALAHVAEIQSHIRCEPLRPFPVDVENGRVSVFV